MNCAAAGSGTPSSGAVPPPSPCIPTGGPGGQRRPRSDTPPPHTATTVKHATKSRRDPLHYRPSASESGGWRDVQSVVRTRRPFARLQGRLCRLAGRGCRTLTCQTWHRSPPDQLIHGDSGQRRRSPALPQRPSVRRRAPGHAALRYGAAARTLCVRGGRARAARLDWAASGADLQRPLQRQQGQTHLHSSTGAN